MRGLAGYNFKAGKLTDQRRQILNDYLLVYEDIGGATEWKDGERTYLVRPKNTSLSIIGVGPYDSETSNGILWGSSEYNILQALAYAMPEEEFYPYKIESDAIYLVEDGEVSFIYRKGSRVSTPDGNGKIFSIDDVNDICVELDRTAAEDVVYEFTIKELEKLIED